METTDSVEAAFGLLEAAVKDAEAQGRTLYGASLKPMLQHQSSGWFDESKLGFSRFKMFLEAARDRGIIEYQRTEGGDFIVKLPVAEDPGEGQLEPSARETERSSAWIRADLWKAFFDWSPRQRYYDTVRDHAFLTTQHHATLTPGQIEIEPITLEQQLEWMRRFAESAEEPFRAVLLAALGEEKPLAAFTMAVKATPLSSEWNRVRIERVAEAIRAWAIQHGVTVEITDTKPSVVSTPGVAAADVEYVRTLLHAAIDQMPAAELLRISVPLQYLIRIR